ncbi:MAG: phospho-sugar mutase [Microbacteriaceae bacterium]
MLGAAWAWHNQDPDDQTRAELQELIERTETGDADAIAELEARFGSRLAFGTAGLRGELAAGPNRMNRVLVAQTAAGLAAYLNARTFQSTASVVIGYDGRKNSDVFARDTAEIMAGSGVRAILLPRMLPTPVLAFAVRQLKVSAGVMVTASHNPPRDNGYKVYLGDENHGSQIVPPADAEIAAEILRATSGSVSDLPRSTEYETADESLIDAYVAASAAVASGAAQSAPEQGSAQLNVVYTAMHGVGWEIAQRVFAAAGFAEPETVSEQIEPDGAFPTVAFPNPEEPGAMDLSFRTARERGAELIIANDPDADRLAVAIPAPDTADGYRRLTGNEVGNILGWMVAEDADAADRHGAIAVSIVSSPALKRVASAYGHDFVETLTGFKWVSRVDGLIYGFEEALGYLVNPQVIRDKDGISAATLFLALAARMKAKGQTIADRMDQFAERFGFFASEQVSFRVSDLAEIARVMTGLRQDPPAELGSIRVDQIDDLIDGYGALPASDVLRIRLEDGSRVVVRPSGTEPKLKVYIDASSDHGTMAQRRADAQGRVSALAEAIRALIAGLRGE